MRNITEAFFSVRLKSKLPVTKPDVINLEPVIAKWHAPTKSILKPMMKAIEEYQMILNGDKVLLCLSGGKDSLSLLHALRQFQFIAKKKGMTFLGKFVNLKRVMMNCF